MSSKAEPGRETPTKKLFDRITKEIAKLYVGQDELVLGALVALFVADDGGYEAEVFWRHDADDGAREAMAAHLQEAFGATHAPAFR